MIFIIEGNSITCFTHKPQRALRSRVFFKGDLSLKDELPWFTQFTNQEGI